MKKSTVTRFAALLITGLVPVCAQNILQNPDFSGPGDDWGSFGNVAFNEFFGSGFGPHASFFADAPANEGLVWDQGISGSAGVEYAFFLNSVNIESNFDGTLSLGLEFYEGDNSTKISDEFILLDLTSATGGGLGFDISSQTVSAIAPVGTVFARPVISFTGGENDGGSENAFVSQATMSVIPEPSSLLLVFAGLSVFLVFRKMKG